MALARADLESLLRARQLDRTLTTALPQVDPGDEHALAPSGISALDARLSGGFPRGQLSELLEGSRAWHSFERVRRFDLHAFLDHRRNENDFAHEPRVGDGKLGDVHPRRHVEAHVHHAAAQWKLRLGADASARRRNPGREQQYDHHGRRCDG